MSHAGGDEQGVELPANMTYVCVISVRRVASQQAPMEGDARPVCPTGSRAK